MSDHRDENEPFDQTNGLAQGLEGDDKGTVDGDTGTDTDEPGGLLGEGFRGLAEPIDPERDFDGETEEDADEAVTPYSEEGKL